MSKEKDAMGELEKSISQTKETSERLEAIGNELEKLKKELEHALREKSFFAAMLSHELRTPLAVIREAMKLLEGDGTAQLTGKQKRFVDMARKNAERMEKLVKDVLEYQKIDAGKIKMNFEQVRVADLLANLRAEAALVAGRGDKELNIRQTRENIIVRCDREKVMQVFMNLIMNADKFTDKGRIEVSAEEKEKEVVFKVKDTGKGIDEEDMPKLFRPFERMSSDDDLPKKGAGLGLAISRMIVETHGGKIWCDSFPGKGSCFFFSLPRESQ